MISLARKLRTLDYFTIGFGTMVGVGWLVLMDDWLQRGGPGGGILGFTLGGAILLPIGYVYGQLIMAIPDAASEIAYTSRVFREEVSFATGWLMMLAYLIVCPWEAVAVGRIASYIFPHLNSLPLYQVTGKPVYLPHLVVGLGLTLLITALNYRGIEFSAKFQNWTTFGLLALFVLFASFGFARGSLANMQPAFSRGRVVSVLLVLQIVPYFMNGFEAVSKCSEEANPEFRRRGYSRAILAAILVGIAFYAAVIATVAYVYPWRALTSQSFATAFAFREAFGSCWVVDIILLAALLSLLKVFNGNFLAASRLFFALGRRGMIDRRAGSVHPQFHTPRTAVLAVGVMTAIMLFSGSSILVFVTEVGSMAAAAGWLAACTAYFFIQRTRTQRGIAMVGALVACALIAMKVFPFVPGHFTRYEWLALILWAGIGIVLRHRRTPTERAAAPAN